MTKQFDPQGRYDVLDDGIRLGELVKGKFYEGGSTSPIGRVFGNQFRYNNGEDVGCIEGLTIVRMDGKVFKLVPQSLWQ